MDIVARIVVFLSISAITIVVGVPVVLGVSLTTLLFSAVFSLISVYILFFANTPLRPNSYRNLDTPWTDQVDRENPLPDYPRPQLVRDSWINLNGVWEYAITQQTSDAPLKFDGEIIVPFPIESRLSGVAKRVKPTEQLWYKTSFSKPDVPFESLLLHFGGVDWHSRIWINGKLAGEHKGGHTGFTQDIAKLINDTDQQELLVCVSDPTNKGVQPRGKQVLRPGNIYYTPVTGIWQTVWMEPLGAQSVSTIGFISDIATRKISMNCELSKSWDNAVLAYEVFLDGEPVVSGSSNQSNIEFVIPEDKFELWSPSAPVLYDFRGKLLINDEEVDSIESYFSCRKIEIKKDTAGINRIFLNNKAEFQLGLLDQGWWPDGLYTAPNDEALKYDIEVTKAMGFNMIRKHVKVEPARWYYHCDYLGMLVWQDMPTGDKNILPKQKDLIRSEESERIFNTELKEMIDQFGFFQSIVCWVPFNEGWGQFKTNEVINRVKAMDPDRLVDGPSGWVDRGEGDMRDYHIYNRQLFVGKTESKRALVIGEFGGIGFRLKNHMAVTNSWSYNNTKNSAHLAARYESLYHDQLLPLLGKGLSAAVYTQTTDVESEINGLLTYDRRVEKIPAKTLCQIHQRVYSEFLKEV